MILNKLMNIAIIGMISISLLYKLCNRLYNEAPKYSRRTLSSQLTEQCIVVLPWVLNWATVSEVLSILNYLRKVEKANREWDAAHSVSERSYG